MKDIPDVIKKEIESKEGKVEFKGLMTLKARIKGIGESYKDVLGWDVLCRWDGKCYEFYCAQYPLIGMTRAEEVTCPLGSRSFDTYKVDFKEALEKMKGMDCGDKFVGMKLYWPLAPGSVEPNWYIRTNLGSQIVVGANSGKKGCHKI